jgi:uncharacterized membrane protein YjgN (DUF898 family)
METWSYAKRGHAHDAPLRVQSARSPLGRGFLLMWGQGLLSLITAGIYYPWAMARVGRWVASHTSVVTG